MTEISFAKKRYVEIFDESTIPLVSLLRVKSVLKSEATKPFPLAETINEFSPRLTQ
jgi:hypothetical protein